MASDLTIEALERLGAADRPAAPTRRMLIIVNPFASTVSDRLRNLVVYALQARYDVEAIDTEAPNHATELCREAAHSNFDVVVAFGGDGTANEVINGIAGTGTAFVPLPGGRVNVFCRILGIPHDIVDATEHLLRMADDWQPRRVDLGRVNDRWFAFSAGVGLDARVVERVDAHPRMKVRWGEWYYSWAAVSTFLRRYVVNKPRLVVESTDGRHEGVLAIVQNTHIYTYFGERPVKLAEGANPTSGTLAGLVLNRASPLDVPTIGYRAFSPRARIVDHRRIRAFATEGAIRVASLDGALVPIQVDGDYIGEAEEAVFTVAPGALTVVS